MAFLAPAAIGAAGAAAGTAAAGTAAAAAGATTVAAAGGSTLLGTLGTALGIGGTLFSGYTAMQQANYNAKLAEQQAMISDQNAALELENAGRAVSSAQVEQLESDNEAAAIIGAQLAAQGASGLSLGGRSQLLTRKAQMELNRKDALNIRQAGDLERYNYKIGALNYTREGQMYRSQAAETKRQGKVAMVSSLFDSASSLISGAKPSSQSRKWAPSPSPRPSSLSAPSLYRRR